MTLWIELFGIVGVKLEIGKLWFTDYCTSEHIAEEMGFFYRQQNITLQFHCFLDFFALLFE
jgi:hypothetical protein